DSYKTNWDGTWMIDSHNGVKDLNIAPINIPRDYPVLFNHLERFKEKLIKRQDKGDHWTNLRNCAYVKEFLKPKIIYQEIAVSMPFLFDENEFFVDTTCFMMTSENEKLHFLTAVFNSSLFRTCFKNNFPENSGNASRMKKVFFQKIPIKKPSETEAALFEKLVPMVQFAKKEKMEAEAAFLEEVIDACVMELYFPEEAAAKNLKFIKPVTALLEEINPSQVIPPGESGSPRHEPSAEIISEFHTRAGNPEHPIRERLNRLATDSPDLFAVIKNEGKVKGNATVL
ncbi:MAG: TaqI-like C-terminal specificity domain-containing protein, partial [bacterium]